jgi:hypothetical protein
MPIDAVCVWSLQCIYPFSSMGCTTQAGSGGSRTGGGAATGMLACPFSNSLAVNAPWQGIFSGCAGSNACNAIVAHLWAGEAAFTFAFDWRRMGHGSTLCPTPVLLPAGPNSPAPRSAASLLGPGAIAHGWKHSSHWPIAMATSDCIRSLHACHYMHSTSFLSPLPSLQASFVCDEAQHVT